MNMHDVVSFDPTDVLAQFNPPFPTEEPFRIDAWQFVGQTIHVDPRRVMPMEGQPRSNPEAIEEMTEGIRTAGQTTPIRVHPVRHPDYDVKIEAGQRRTLGCIRAGCMVRAEIRPVPQNDRAHLIAAVAENFNRKDLSLLDTVHLVVELLGYECSYAEIAKILGKSRVQIGQYAAIGTLHPDVFPFLEEHPDRTEYVSDRGRKLRRTVALTMGAAILLAKLPRGEQLEAAQAIIDEKMPDASAKDFVRQRMATGGHMRRYEQSPATLMSLLDEGVMRAEACAVKYAGMPSTVLRAMSQTRDGVQRDILSRRIRGLTVSLNVLAEGMQLGIPEGEKEETENGQQVSLFQLHPKLRSWVKEQLSAWRQSGLSLEAWQDRQILDAWKKSGKI